MAIANGTTLGPYEILAPIGAGGMGEVYQARDTRLERIVAIKVLAEHFSSNSEHKQRFEREAKAISSLQHPHICTLYDVGHQDGTDYLVMEYLEGETLAQRLFRGPLPTPQLLKIGMEMADALERAHRQGVVHRDLKPGNVVLTKSGAKLVDFGLAKPARMATTSSLSAVTAPSPVSPTGPITEKGIVVGTFQYMSPEQIEGKEADGRSDIFALGAVLYEMATGKRAFEGKSQLSVASAILEKEPEPITTAQPLAPAALEHVIKVCLAKDPEERWQSSADVMRELKWIEESGSRAAPATPARSLRLSRWARVGVAVTGWVLALAAMVSTGFYARRAGTASQLVKADINPPAGQEFGGVVNGSVALSPRGDRLAFLGFSGKSRALWVRDLATGQSQVLAGTEEAAFPFWSFDGRFLAFFADGRLKKIAASGGAVEVLCDAPNGRGGTWGAEGVILFTPNIADALYQVPEGGGTPRAVTQPEKGVSHRFPRFLPDGKHFVFILRGTAQETVGDLYAGSLDGSAPKLVLSPGSVAQYAGGFLLFIKNGNLVAQGFSLRDLAVSGSPVAIAEKVEYFSQRDIGNFSASERGALVYRPEPFTQVQYQWVDRAGRMLGSVGAPGFLSDPRLSPDGKKLATFLGEAGGTGDLWVVDVERNAASRLTFLRTQSASAVFSPDGREIIWAEGKGWSGTLMRQPAAGGGAAQKLMEADTGLAVYEWTRDGRSVILGRQDVTNDWDILHLSLTGEPKPRPIVNGPFLELDARLSPNGRWLAYASGESGRLEVYVTAFPGPGGRWQVSSSGGVSPRWSPDGKELYYVGENKMRTVEIPNADQFSLGPARELFDMDPNLPQFDVAPDGKRFLVQKRAGEATAPPLNLVLNWEKLAEK